MQRSDLADLAAFARVAHHRGFRRAAAELGVSPSALSHAIRGLETRMGVRLLNRTSRAVSPTEAGAALLTRLAPALAEIGAAVDEATSKPDDPTGTLRLNAPRSACRLVLAPLVHEFVAQHPRVRVEMLTDERMTDIVGEGFDAGVRLQERLARDMIAIPLGGPRRFAIVATPAFLAEHGTPEHPDDLRNLPCIRQRLPSGALLKWELERDGTPFDIQVDGPLTVNDQVFARDAALAGLGLGYIYEDWAEKDLGAGLLVSVMAEWCPSFPGFHLYFPTGRQMPPPLRAFVDMVKRRRT